jgi:hypothetical protein
MSIISDRFRGKPGQFLPLSVGIGCNLAHNQRQAARRQGPQVAWSAPLQDAIFHPPGTLTPTLSQPAA